MRFTVLVSLVVVAVNVVTGTLIAWVLVRDEFPGKRFVNALIDLPFALPTIVAGLVLLALYGPKGPAPFDIGFTRIAVALALLFVTLPFVVRSVQPVLMELDREMEEAATSLGARPRTVFARIVLPNLVPAIAAGAGLAFARALGEFGSVVLISRQHPVQDRGRVGLPVRPDRVRQHRRRGGGQRRAARAVVRAAAVRQLGLDARAAPCAASSRASRLTLRVARARLPRRAARDPRRDGLLPDVRGRDRPGAGRPSRRRRRSTRSG